MEVFSRFEATLRSGIELGLPPSPDQRLLDAGQEPYDSGGVGEIVEHGIGFDALERIGRIATCPNEQTPDTGRWAQSRSRGVSPITQTRSGSARQPVCSTTPPWREAPGRPTQPVWYPLRYAPTLQIEQGVPNRRPPL